MNKIALFTVIFCNTIGWTACLAGEFQKMKILDEQAVTAQLNMAVAKQNAEAEQRYQKARGEYLLQQTLYEEMRMRYLSELDEYEVRQALYTEETKKNNLQRQQYLQGRSSK